MMGAARPKGGTRPIRPRRLTSDRGQAAEMAVLERWRRLTRQSRADHPCTYWPCCFAAGASPGTGASRHPRHAAVSPIA